MKIRTENAHSNSAVGLGGEADVVDDALSQGGVGVHLEATFEERMADEPDGEQVAALEVVVGDSSTK